MTFVAERSALPATADRLGSRVRTGGELLAALPREHPRLISYLVPVLVAAIATTGWFRPGRFVAAGDVEPFLRDGLAAELPSSWGHRLTGAGSPSYEIARSFEVALVRVVEQIGGSAVDAQQLLYALVFASAAFGTAFFVRGLVPDRPEIACAAGLLGAFNPYVLVMLPNPLFPLAIGVAGVLGGWFVRAAAARRISPAAVALSTLPVGYLSVNPPMIAVLAGWCALVCAASSRLVGPGGGRRAVALAMRSAPLVALAGLWWVVPMVQVLTSSESVSVAAETGAERWAWSHADNSIGNVVTMKAHWAWRYPDFYPYAERLDRGLWPWLRWIVPVAAAASLVHRRARTMAGTLLAIAAVLVVVAKGLHWPFADANRWLYESVPGFWLLREPMSKVGPLLVLVLVAAAATALAGAIARVGNITEPRARLAAATTLACLAVGALVAPWPLWNGDVIADDRGALPSAHVVVPDEWYEVADVVNASPSPGKVLVLPLNDFYQVTTTWGYHGVNAPVQQLVTRPVVQPMPGGYFSPQAGFSDLVAAVERSLVRDDVAGLGSLLTALGVSQVVVRHDVVPGTANRDLVDSRELTDVLSAWSGMRATARTTVADVFERTEASGVVRASTDLVGIDATIDGPALVAAVTRGAIAVESDDVRAERRAAHLAGTDAVSFVLNGSGSLETVPLDGPRAYAVTVDETTIELHDLAESTIDGVAVRRAAIRRPRTSSAAVVAITSPDGTTGFVPGRTAVRLDRGDSVRTWSSAGALATSPWSSLENCNAVTDRTPSEVGLDATVAGGVLRLQADDHSACSWQRIDLPQRPDAPVRVEVDVRTVQGRAARLCIWQVGPDACAATPPLPASASWHTFEAFVRPADGTRELRLYAYADGSAERTITEFGVVTAEALAPADELELVSTPGSATTALAPGEHVVRTSSNPLDVGAFSSVEDCHAFDARDAAAAGLAVSAIDGRVLLSADAHTACTWAAVGGHVGASRVHVRFEHRTLAGLPARVCLWQVGPDRCAELPDVPASRSWSTFDEVAEIESGTVALRIYLYADGPDSDATTLVHFDDLEITPAALDTFVVVDSTTEPAAPPTIETHQVSSSQHRVDVSGADGRFLLTLAESWDPGWELSGLPDGWRATHVRADGYANAWLVTGTGGATLDLRYTPDRLARAALGVSSVGVALLGAWVLLIARPRRRASGRLPVRAVRSVAGRRRTPRQRWPRSRRSRPGRGRHSSSS